MFKNKCRQSLTFKIFLITSLILLFTSILTLSIISLATPITYTNLSSEELAKKSTLLLEKLAVTDIKEAGTILDQFIIDQNVYLLLTDENGKIIDDISQFALTQQNEFDQDGNLIEQIYTTYDTAIKTMEEEGDTMLTTLTSNENSLTYEVCFKDQNHSYYLTLIPRRKMVNQTVQALQKVAPWLLAIMLIISLIGARIYAFYITKPILKLNQAAQHLAQLDFDYSISQHRQDEIGQLSQHLNELAVKLNLALTELKGSNAKLSNALDEQKTLIQQKTTFFNAASHELKTPLTILKGNLEGMIANIPPYDQHDIYLARCLKVTHRMDELIKEILMISKLEKNHHLYERKRLTLTPFIQELCQLDELLIEEKKLQLIFDLKNDFCFEGDSSLIRKMIDNLLSNAIFYSPCQATIRICCRHNKQEGILEIENTGVHIKEENLDKLFDCFYREDSSRNRQTGGSGLGLTLVRLILNEHKGSIKAYNSKEGVVFQVRLPIITQ